MAAKAIYWISTGLFCAFLGGSGFGYLAGAEPFVEGITHLGYPLYFLTILGAAKVLGAAALLAPGSPILKEWAYAGFSFDLIGAAASHAFAGDPLAEVLPPVVVLLVGAASYLLRPISRRVPGSLALGAEPVVASPTGATSP
jgi:hypothetical protein